MNDTTHQYPFDVEHLAGVFSRAYDSVESKRRAENVVRDVEKLGVVPSLNLLPTYEQLSVPYYTFGDSDFALDNLEKEVADTMKAVGFGLNWGDLFLLSYVCEFGRSILGEDWVLKFRDKLSSLPDHIATIEEFWWLSLWHSPSEIESEVRLRKDCAKSIDWRFKSCGQIVNLEVKFRPKDWKRTIDGQMYSVVQKSLFEGIAEKFPEKHEGELNLVGITLLGPLNRETAEAANNFLAENEMIDGLIYWSTGMADQPPEQFHLRPNARHAQLLFRKPEYYYYRSTLIVHPWMDSERRRAKWLGIEEDFSQIDGFRRKVGKILVPAQAARQSW